MKMGVGVCGVLQGHSTDLAPLPANLALVLLHSDIGVHALAADQLKVTVPPIGLLVLQGVHYCKVVLGAPNRQIHLPCQFHSGFACRLQLGLHKLNPQEGIYLV